MINIIKMRRENYSTLKDAYTEKFFVSYAVKGPIIDKDAGVRMDTPLYGPLSNNPIKEPSPLNTEYVYDFRKNLYKDVSQ